MAHQHAAGGGLGGGGTLNVEDGGKVDSPSGWIGLELGSTGVVTITGSGSMWETGDTQIGTLAVGFRGSGTLDVEKGGVVRNHDGGIIGEMAGSTGIATVTGKGSQWNNSKDVTVGNRGSRTLNVEAGGVVSNTDGYIGSGSFEGSSGFKTGTGVVTVTGFTWTDTNNDGLRDPAEVAGSQWNNSDDLAVGNWGDGKLNVKDGGAVSSDTGWIGYEEQSRGVATVTGTDSRWEISKGLIVGDLPFSSGTLNIETGGTVSNGIGFIGHNAFSTGVVTVTGPGSKWNNESNGEELGGDGEIIVGRKGSGTLNVEAGGVVESTEGWIGKESQSTGIATVTGEGSKWNNSKDLSVGGWRGVRGNGTLKVEADGEVSNEVGWIGRGLGSTDVATVTGSLSQWNNSKNLTVGWSGEGTLNVKKGGKVSNKGLGYIGFNAGSTGVATVTGTDSDGTPSQWNDSKFLHVGWKGTGTLNVEEGGVVASKQLTVGWQGSGTLNVKASGVVENDFGWIGYEKESTGVVTVTSKDSNGMPSQWNSDRLVVGRDGSGTLKIEEGGVVKSASGDINFSAGLIGHRAGSKGVVTVNGKDANGTPSQWNNSSSLEVGFEGDGTLLVEAGGVVSSTNGYIGKLPSSEGVATVAGPGSRWNINGWLKIGGSKLGLGGAGTLNINDGGKVTVSRTTKLWADGTVNPTVEYSIPAACMRRQAPSICSVDSFILPPWSAILTSKEGSWPLAEAPEA